jgi:ABC-type dipeptide/oligopeptide/nickel transport system permease component
VTRYLLRRLLALGPTLLGVSLLSFLFLRLVPATPSPYGSAPAPS